MTTLPHPLPMSTDVRARLATALNRNLHQIMLLEWQLRQAHWNTRGSWFFARHELFEQVGGRLYEAADLVAERIGALGYAAEADPLMVRQDALPMVSPGLQSGDIFLDELTRNMVRLSQSLRDTLDDANKLGDPITEDLVTEVARNTEKDAWFLRSHLDGGQRSPQALTKVPVLPLSEGAEREETRRTAREARGEPAVAAAAEH